MATEQKIYGVGADEKYATVRAAVDAARAAGDQNVHFKVDAGVYQNDGAYIRGFQSVTVEGVGGAARFVATRDSPDQKAIFTVDNSTTFLNVELTGAHVESGNGAGIRHQGGDLVVRDSFLHDNQNGILSTPYQKGSGSVLLERVEIANNGYGQGGQSHNLYIGQVGNFTMRDSYSHDSAIGHEVKSRALVNLIENNRIQNNQTGTGSYNIDLPNGGQSIVRGNVIQQSATSDNNNIMTFGVEGNVHAGSSLLVTDNTIVNDKNGYATYGEIVANAVPGAVTVTGNRIWTAAEKVIVDEITRTWPPGGELAIGVPGQTGNTRLEARPEMDTRHVPSLKLQDGVAGSGPDRLVLELSENRFLGNDASEAQAGEAHRHAQFRVSVDGVMLNTDEQTVFADHAKGETVQFTYEGDFGPGQHVVAVHFVNKDWNLSGGTGRDLWVEGITLNGVEVPLEAGPEGFQQTGLQTTKAYLAPPAATLQDGAGGPVTSQPLPAPAPTPAPLPVPPPAAEPVTPAPTGPGAGPTGPDELVLQLSADAYQGNPLFSVTVDGRAVGSPTEVSALRRDGDTQEFTLRGDFGAGDHEVTVSFLNDAYAGTAETDRNLHIEGLSLNGVALLDEAHTMFSAGTASFDAPAPVLPDALVLRLSADAYQGNPLFSVTVDGAQVGAPTEVTALRKAGDTQEFTLRGDFGAGAHTVEVSFLNDAYAGTAETDRNLHIESVSLNGVTISGGAHTMFSAGVTGYSAAAPASPTSPAPVPVPAPAPAPGPVAQPQDPLLRFFQEFAEGLHTGQFDAGIGDLLEAAIPELEQAVGASPKAAELYESMFAEAGQYLDNLAHGRG